MKLLLVTFLLLSSIAAWPAMSAEPHWLEEDMDSAEANAAAQAALAKLGPDRGAIVLTGQAIVLVAGFDGGEIYIEGSDTGGIDIIGLGDDTSGAALDLEGTVTDLEGLVTDLDADVTDYGYKISLSGDVLFEFDKADLKPAATQTLQKVVVLATKGNAAEVLVEGHTDSKGSDDYNMALSKRRAESVRSWLVDTGGLDAAIVNAQGLGETQAVAENENLDGTDNPDGRAQNRRVDIYVKK